ncbi:threonine synthase [Pseudactinotalea terrae]|uniref:threonine synthase n=1 Tax=Pseudactinotalea terrae TaxID=1743262 RepID=UPI0019D5F669|nr:threonine synthase [Pseudactinotalea terrae]
MAGLIALLPDLVCVVCGTTYPVTSLTWRCRCGGVLDVTAFGPHLDVAALPDGPTSMWRYADVLPVPLDTRVSLGEGLTPLVVSSAHEDVWLKCDFLMPTASFKDRGAAVLATTAKRLGVNQAIVDSSGNAGTAAAAYFARAGIPVQVLVPAATSPGKLAQMYAHGANVVLVDGDRAATAAAALDAAERPGVLYASHVYHPYFVHGVKTYGYEIWEQLGRWLPDVVMVPVGNGTLVLGCALAFAELYAQGLIDRAPRIVAVQSSSCAPLAQAWAAGLDEVTAVPTRPTIAEGIAITAPPRGPQILAAIRGSGGTIVTVDDDQVLQAQTDLAAQGLFVEPTSAVCYAAVEHARTAGAPRDPDDEALEALRTGEVVVPLCGSGLKTGKAPQHVGT